MPGGSLSAASDRTGETAIPTSDATLTRLRDFLSHPVFTDTAPDVRLDPGDGELSGVVLSGPPYAIAHILRGLSAAGWHTARTGDGSLWVPPGR